MIVLDASVVVDLLLQARDATRVEERLFASGETLHAPHLIDIEVAHALRRRVLRGDMTAGRGRVALDVLAVFPLVRYPHEDLIDRIWALRANFSAYDAAYVALAEGLGATLVTRDERLAKARGTRAVIAVI